MAPRLVSTDFYRVFTELRESGPLIFSDYLINGGSSKKNKTKRTRYGFWFLPPAPPRPNGLIMIPMFDKLHFAMKIIALWKLQNSREPNFVPFASADGLPDTHTHKQTKWEDNEHPFRWYSKTNLIMAAFRERGGRPPNGFTIAIFAVVCLVFFHFARSKRCDEWNGFVLPCFT